MTQVLLIEDDLENCEILSMYLMKSQRYQVSIAHSAEETMALLKRRTFDLVLLDIMLPDMNGVDLCVELRRKMFCPIIFISCLDDEETIVRAIHLGGDDYLTKPFRAPVLLAHMDAVMRRVPQNAEKDEDIPIGGFHLSVKNHTLEKNGESVYLSPTEFELLMYLIRSDGELVPYEELFEQIWRRPSYGDLRTVFTHVRNLRKKLEDDPSSPRFLLTITRTGYRFDRSGGKS